MLFLYIDGIRDLQVSLEFVCDRFVSACWYFLVSNIFMPHPLSEVFLPYSYFAHLVVLFYVLGMVYYYGLWMVVVLLASRRGAHAIASKSTLSS